MTRTIRPAETKTFAGSRDFGIAIRTLILDALKHGSDVIVDLEGIEDMTPSFADECFGKLAEAMKSSERSRVKLVNEERFRQLIEGVTRLRIQRLEQRKSSS